MMRIIAMVSSIEEKLKNTNKQYTLLSKKYRKNSIKYNKSLSFLREIVCFLGGTLGSAPMTQEKNGTNGTP